MTPNVKELTARLLEAIDGRYPIGLFHGTMGLSICFYRLKPLLGDHARGGGQSRRLAQQIFSALPAASINTPL